VPLGVYIYVCMYVYMLLSNIGVIHLLLPLGHQAYHIYPTYKGSNKCMFIEPSRVSFHVCSLKVVPLGWNARKLL